MADDPGERVYQESGSRLTELQLPRGDVTEGVVRIGDTVRRPHQPQSLAVAGYLDHLERVGFQGSPRYLGRDAHGRDVLTFLEGDVAGDPPEPWATTDQLLLDVLNAAMWWVPLRHPDDLAPHWRDLDAPARLRRFADAYGLPHGDRERLVPLGIARADVTYGRMQAAAEQLGGGWARMWQEGAGNSIRRRQAWLRERAGELDAALLAPG